LQVLAVHRPRYNDWSWPKGKLANGETLPQCAVREVAEETQLQVTLGVPLSTLKYTVGGRNKVVYYWAAKATSSTSPALHARPPVKSAPKHEIDEAVWLSVPVLRERITWEHDRKPLEDLVDLYESDRLKTRAFIVARHGRAKRRYSWNGDDAERPLTKSGARRARQLVPLFAAFGVKSVNSSPAQRCVDTVAPYANAAGLKVVTFDALTEPGHASTPLSTAATLINLLGKSESRVVCVHRPTLPTVIEMVRASTRKYTRGTLPKKNPYLSAGSVMVAHVVDTDSGPRIAALETHTLDLVHEDARDEVLIA